MKNLVEEAIDLLGREEYLAAFYCCETLIDHYKSEFMEKLTVNTATDYVGGVILYAQICSAMKKPWKAFPILEASRGALRFLRDFMADSQTLAEIYNSFGDAYAYGTYFPEAVICYSEAARYFQSLEKANAALSSAFFYQARFGKELLTDLSFAQEKFGIKRLDEIKNASVAEVEGQILTDPIESSEVYLKIRFDVEEKTDKILSQKNLEGIPYCVLYWHTKKEVLKEDFGIDWKTPEEMNPHIRFY